jgi:hypothetical protein
MTVATTAQEIAALKRAVRDLETRLDALQGAAPDSEAFRDEVRKEFATTREFIDRNQQSNDAMFKVVFRQLEADRLMADQRQAISDRRHAEIMGQLEKILTQPREN